MSSRQHALIVSWDQLHRDCRTLARLLNDIGPFDAIFSIARGGLVPAAIVARELGVRVIDTVCVASYHQYDKQGEIEVLKDTSTMVLGRAHGQESKVLLIDDLVDTGETAKVVKRLLPMAHFATVYAKPRGRPLVDTFVTEVSQDTWIYFPWDTGLAFQRPLSGEG